MEPDRYIPGVPCWVDSSHRDPQAAGEFYSALFGWELEDRRLHGSPTPYLVARLDGGDVAALASAPDSASAPGVWNTYVLVHSADATAAAVRQAGGRVLDEPFDMGEAGRMGTFADPAGAVFRVWQAKAHRGAQVVNQPGSVVFNDLMTRDPEGARAFYRAVFGWRTLATDGDADIMWTLPGYGDHLERRTPGLRARMAEMGAPVGFEDVVATLHPLRADEAEVPSHWGVTFSVADADATAQRARQLGGRVLVEPFDAPWVRVAVIADPQGATFNASQFVPEQVDRSPRGDAAGEQG